jgi:hypothetical protein
MSNDRQLTASTSSTGRLMTLFSYPPAEPGEAALSATETIHVFTKDQTWQSLSVADYETQFQTQLIHGVVCDKQYAPLQEKLQQHLAELKDDMPQDRAALTAFFENPGDYFNLTHVSDNCGYRTIASQFIPQGTIVGIYSAELLFIKEGEQPGPSTEDDLAVTGEAENLAIDGVNYKLRFRATAAGDLTRYALHAPDLAKVAFYANHGLLEYGVDWKQILRANVSYHQAIVNNIPVCYFKARENIEKNALIVIDYGRFWKGHESELPKHKMPRTNVVETMPCLFLRTASSSRIAKLKFLEGQYRPSGSKHVNLPTVDPAESKASAVPKLGK